MAHNLYRMPALLSVDLLLKDVGSSKDACLSKDDLSSKDVDSSNFERAI